MASQNLLILRFQKFHNTKLPAAGRHCWGRSFNWQSVEFENLFVNRDSEKSAANKTKFLRRKIEHFSLTCTINWSLWSQCIRINHGKLQYRGWKQRKHQTKWWWVSAEEKWEKKCWLRGGSFCQFRSKRNGFCDPIYNYLAVDFLSDDESESPPKPTASICIAASDKIQANHLTSRPRSIKNSPRPKKKKEKKFA